MKVLYLEDHAFFGDSIYNILKQDFPELEVDYAKSFSQAETLMATKAYDLSILDVVLQNGKTGIHFAEGYGKSLGKILFVTGCKDELTLKMLQKYKHVPKDIKVLEDIKVFIKTNAK